MITIKFKLLIKYFTSIVIIASIIMIFLVNISFAQDVYFLQPVPSPGGTIGSTIGSNVLSTYLINLFNLSIGASAILAVLMIVVGGVQYVGSSVSPSQKQAAIETIQGAVLGLLIVLGAYAILFTINKDLVTSSLDIPSLKPSGAGPPGGGAPGGGGAPAPSAAVCSACGGSSRCNNFDCPGGCKWVTRGSTRIGPSGVCSLP